MTDLKYQILEALYNAPDRSMMMSDLLNPYRGGTLDAAQEIYFRLIKGGFIRESSQVVELTDSGYDLYEAVKDERDRRAESERRERQAYKIAVITTVATLVSAAATLLSVVPAFIQLFL